MADTTEDKLAISTLFRPRFLDTLHHLVEEKSKRVREVKKGQVLSINVRRRRRVSALSTGQEIKSALKQLPLEARAGRLISAIAIQAA